MDCGIRHNMGEPLIVIQGAPMSCFQRQRKQCRRDQRVWHKGSEVRKRDPINKAKWAALLYQQRRNPDFLATERGQQRYEPARQRRGHGGKEIEAMKGCCVGKSCAQVFPLPLRTYGLQQDLILLALPHEKRPFPSPTRRPTLLHIPGAGPGTARQAADPHPRTPGPDQGNTIENLSGQRDQATGIYHALSGHVGVEHGGASPLCRSHPRGRGGCPRPRVCRPGAGRRGRAVP